MEEGDVRVEGLTSKAEGLTGAIAVALLFAAAAGGGTDPARRIAIRVPEGFSPGPEFERFSGWARREGVEVEVGPEASPVPAGWEAARVAVLPASAAFRRLVARFPVRLTEKEFVFDGRTYGQSDDAVALTDS